MEAGPGCTDVPAQTQKRSGPPPPLDDPGNEVAEPSVASTRSPCNDPGSSAYATRGLKSIRPRGLAARGGHGGPSSQKGTHTSPSQQVAVTHAVPAGQSRLRVQLWNPEHELLRQFEHMREPSVVLRHAQSVEHAVGFPQVEPAVHRGGQAV